ncbi:hypothetical protein ACEPPN_003482 [Leptodophora sp. 'Broadleaf-Isolate-01']
MSSTAIPTTTKAWAVEGKDGFESLKLKNEVPIPALSENEVLVKIHAASLNYRDLAITKGMYPLGLKSGVVPCSDGAGEVIAVGSKVVTLFNQGHIAGSLDKQTSVTGLGGSLDGTLRQYGTFNEAGLVDMPPSLNWQEAFTLSCAALTPWNALYGLKPLAPGDVFAKAAGATVIATTSSSAKAEILKKLGADHVINYKDTPEWGEKAASLTPKNAGVNHVLEFGGPATMAQSLKAVKIDGVISIIGVLGGFSKEQPRFMDVLMNLYTVRGLLVGSRAQFEDMNRAIEANGIKPVVDEKVFSLEQAKEAYQYMFAQKHFGKLTIKIE